MIRTHIDTSELGTIVRKIDRLESVGVELMNDALERLANDKAREARGKAKHSTIRQNIEVYERQHLRVGFVAFLVGVEQRFPQDRLALFLLRGTLTRRRKKYREPGRYYIGKKKRKAPGTQSGRWSNYKRHNRGRTGRKHARPDRGGVSVHRFLTPIPRKKQGDVLLEAIRDAAKRSGLDTGGITI